MIERAHTHKHKPNDLYLPLPAIPENTNHRLPPRTTHSQRHMTPKSITTVSPEDQMLQDQIRLLFKEPKRKTKQKRSKTRLRSVGAQQNVKNRSSLPLISSSQEKKVTVSPLPPKPPKIKHNQAERKMELDAILSQKNRFIQNYFIELNTKKRRINTKA